MSRKDELYAKACKRIAELEQEVERLTKWKELTKCHAPREAAIATLLQENTSLRDEVERLRKSFNLLIEEAQSVSIAYDEAYEEHEVPLSWPSPDAIVIAIDNARRALEGRE